MENSPAPGSSGLNVRPAGTGAIAGLLHMVDLPLDFRRCTLSLRGHA
jgi:hypothetical protein